MKTQVNKWFRWGAAGAFGLMLTLNVMVGLEFDKDKALPTLTLVELGGQALASDESDPGGGSGVYYVQFDYCGSYYSNCNKRVLKCRSTGGKYCSPSIQLPCGEACS